LKVVMLASKINIRLNTSMSPILYPGVYVMRRQSEPLDHQQPVKQEKPIEQPVGLGSSRFRNPDFADQREDYPDDDR